MGNSFAPLSLPEPFTTYGSWNQKDIDAVIKQFEYEDIAFSIDFANLLKLTKLSKDKKHLMQVFKSFDTNEWNIINTLDLLCGIAVLCKGTVEEKLNTVFDAFDFDNSGSILYEENVILLVGTLRGIFAIAKTCAEPEESEMDKITEEIYKEFGLIKENSLKKEYFLSWILKFINYDTLGDSLTIEDVLIAFKLFEKMEEEEKVEVVKGHIDKVETINCEEINQIIETKSMPMGGIIENSSENMIIEQKITDSSIHKKPFLISNSTKEEIKEINSFEVQEVQYGSNIAVNALKCEHITEDSSEDGEETGDHIFLSPKIIKKEKNANNKTIEQIIKIKNEIPLCKERFDKDIESVAISTSNFVLLEAIGKLCELQPKVINTNTDKVSEIKQDGKEYLRKLSTVRKVSNIFIENIFTQAYCNIDYHKVIASVNDNKHDYITKIYDENSGHFYYFNNNTGVSSWNYADLLIVVPFHQKVSTMTPNEAAVLIQSLFRRRVARKNIIRLIFAIYEKIFDKNSGFFFYYNKQTGESSWSSPLILHGLEMPITPRSESEAIGYGVSVNIVVGSTVNVRMEDQHINVEKILTKDEAAVIIQCLFRTRRARKHIVELCSMFYDKIYDSTSGHYYYYNKKTFESSWHPPKLLRGIELPNSNDYIYSP